MRASGRIVNYPKALLSDPRHNVLIRGNEASGTPGAQIQKCGPEGRFVELGGERCIIRAVILTLSGYSALRTLIRETCSVLYQVLSRSRNRCV